MKKYKCRICNSKLTKNFLDLGFSPLSNSYVKKKDIKKKEIYLPLKVFFCFNCKLVQLPEHEKPKNIFLNYDYLSSPSQSWLNHSKKYVDSISKYLKKIYIKKKIKVCEIASNDGYLLQFFDRSKFDILGIEPAKNIAKIAKKKNIPTITSFFNFELANRITKNKGKFDLIIGNNVFAHVPNIKNFTKGMETLLSDNGVISLEFPHLLNLIKFKQFDTIYHEHFSYYSLRSVIFLLNKFDLEVFNLTKLSTHGGSLRVFIKKKKNNIIEVNRIKIRKILNEEKDNKIFSISTFNKFQNQIDKLKIDFKNLLIEKKFLKKKVVAYGAPAKGNTFLNFCSVNKDLISFTVDRAKTKIGKYLPGSKIPIFKTSKLKKFNPDFIIILPWNLKKEIVHQLKKMKLRTTYITCIPRLKIFK